jgi:hypothetical protein
MDQQESELRRRANEVGLKVAALDWLDEKARGVPKGHTDRCDALDYTGYAAPCTCGFDNNQEVKIIKLLKGLLMKDM